jgi:hypothetical protein
MAATVSTALIVCALIIFPTIAAGLVMAVCEILLDR